MICPSLPRRICSMPRRGFPRLCAHSTPWLYRHCRRFPSLLQSFSLFLHKAALRNCPSGWANLGLAASLTSATTKATSGAVWEGLTGAVVPGAGISLEVLEKATTFSQAATSCVQNFLLGNLGIPLKTTTKKGNPSSLKFQWDDLNQSHSTDGLWPCSPCQNPRVNMSPVQHHLLAQWSANLFGPTALPIKNFWACTPNLCIFSSKLCTCAAVLMYYEHYQT